MIFSYSFSLIETLALAAVGWSLGQLLVTRVSILHRLCLPAPVLGGLILCGISTLGKGLGVHLEWDTSLQTPLMIGFFLSIGWMASLRNLRLGGSQVFRFLLICCGFLLIQNLVGIALAYSLGQNPLLGLLAGSVSLTGGPGTALAFAPAFEKAGVSAAGAIGTACALAGILLGGVLGSPSAMRLIENAKSRRDASEQPLNGRATSLETGFGSLEPKHLSVHLGFFFIAMAIGACLGRSIQSLGITLPIYIGAMIVAAILRNLHDRYQHKGFSDQWIEEIGSVALSYFLVIATMTLQVNQLSAIAGSLFWILAAQTAVVLVFAGTLVFRWMGRDHDAAVMSGGFVGFMLGTTANAMANMDAVTSRYGAAPRAYLVVPLVGACFIDFINAIVITFLIPIFS